MTLIKDYVILGVLFLFVGFAVPCIAQQYPQAKGYVVDEAGLLGDQDKQNIEQMLLEV